MLRVYNSPSLLFRAFIIKAFHLKDCINDVTSRSSTSGRKRGTAEFSWAAIIGRGGGGLCQELLVSFLPMLRIPEANGEKYCLPG